MVAVPGLDPTVCETADVVLVVEITSPGNAAADHALKPQLYARAAVPHYLRIELHETGPSAVVHRRRRDRYIEVARVDPGKQCRSDRPV